MKNKILTLLFLLLVSAWIAACGNENRIGSMNSSRGEEIKSEQQKNEQEKETEEQSEPTEEANEETTLEKQIIFDQNGMVITATGIDNEGSFMGPEIKFLIENNSEKALTVQARNVSVNGYMVDTSMSADVSPGKKSNDSLTITKSSLDECGIENIAYVDFSFHIFNSDSWSDSFDTEMIHIETSCANDYAQSYDDSGEVIYESGGIKIVSKGISEDASFLGLSLVFYIENNSEESITIQARDVSVNGFMIDPVFSCEITSGNRAISTVTFMKSDMEDNQIDSIDEVEMSFHIFKTDGWDTIQDTEPVTIKFQ